MLLEYKKDENGQDILSSTDGVHQVMMEWEKPYMEKCIEVLNPTGNVLEIGFGMGYSASKILKHDIKSYTVIECCPVVWEKIEEWKSKQKKEISINILKGRWEDLISIAGTYDSIFFDDYCHSSEDRGRFSKFIEMCLKYNMNIGSRVGVYSTANISNIEGDFLIIKNQEYNIDIPSHCKYAKGDKMYIPIIEKTGNFNDSFKIIKPDQKYGRLNSMSLVAVKNYVPKYYNKCNLIIIDDIYDNVHDVRKYILNESISLRELPDNLKSVAKSYIQDNITSFSKEMFEYYTCNKTSYINFYENYDWCAIIFLSPNAPVNSGIIFYENKQTHDRYHCEKEITNLRDMTKWKIVDRVGNLYNRMVLFNCKRYHAHVENFGDDNKTCKLFSMFLMKTGSV